MKFVAIKDNLKEAILLVEKTTGKKVTLPILNAILFKAEKGAITLTATNLETGIEVWIPGKVVEEGQVALPARVISSYVSFLTDEQVSLESQKENLTITASRGKTLIKGFPAADFPLLPKLKRDYVFSVNSAAVREALGQVLVAAATSDIKPEIASVFFQFAPKGLTIAATDSFRLTERKIEALFKMEGESMGMLLPSRSASELMRLLEIDDGEVEINIAKGQVTFVTKRFQMVSRLTEGSFPDYGRIIPTKFATEVTIKREELIQALRLSGLFAGKLNDVALALNASKGTIELTTANTEVGESVSRVEAAIRGDSLTISFNLRYFLDGINQLTSERIFLGFNGSSGPVLMRNQEAINYFYIAMPMRV